ncbi:hypothetical protein PI124_g18313 [Phytophthora idaei]|nr:hypothetical protein PI125_g19076 [Phytophthora idaei]KAG3236686.1 hypothetical protein PI124_g18313 [Phytophthora idaei]
MVRPVIKPSLAPLWAIVTTGRIYGAVDMAVTISYGTATPANDSSWRLCAVIYEEEIRVILGKKMT